MVKQKAIPQEDQNLINQALKRKGKADTVTKYAGGQVVKESVELKSDRTVVIRDYTGRSLKHDKWIIPKGGNQELVAAKGTLYEDVPPERRELVSWSEADFV